jgi:hypothetical protein
MMIQSAFIANAAFLIINLLFNTTMEQRFDITAFCSNNKYEFGEENLTYIHVNDKRISEFIEKNIHDKLNIGAVAVDLLTWFDKNVEYSRLNAPFFPLQRSDLDVISMKSGTCGDFSNLIVSILISLGYETKYAYVHKDCYGDEQDHICAAVWDADEWILIDATQPYRKWYGFKCPHREYELLTPVAFEMKMKKEEAYWIDIAERYGNRLYAGLLYAPWIRERIIKQTDSIIESIFYLLLFNDQKEFTLYAYFKRYSRENGTIPMMSILAENTQTYCFSCKKPASIWDDEQWGDKYEEKDIPYDFQTEELTAFKMNISEDLPGIKLIISDLNIKEFPYIQK